MQIARGPRYAATFGPGAILPRKRPAADVAGASGDLWDVMSTTVPLQRAGGETAVGGAVQPWDLIYGRDVAGAA